MKKIFLPLCLMLLCRAAGAAEQRVMAYANPAHAAEIDDTARYYRDKFYPQLKLMRKEEVKYGDDVTVFVGPLGGSSWPSGFVWEFGMDVDSWTFSMGGRTFSRNCGLIVRVTSCSDYTDEDIRTGLDWQAAWTTFYVSSSAVENAFAAAGTCSDRHFLVSYPSKPGMILAQGMAHRDSGGPHVLYDESVNVPDPCGKYYATLATSTGTHIAYHYTRGSWAEGSMKDFIPRTERQMEELKDYFGMPALPHMDYFLFDSLAEKETCSGMRGNAHAMTNAGEPEVFAVHASTLSATGKHEFVHVFADQYWGRSGTTLLREGLAVQMDGGWQGRPFPYWLAELRRRKALPTLATLLGDMNYWYANSSDAYAAAGSFADFLLRRFGKDKFREAYPLNLDDATARRIFGQDLPSLEKDWLKEGDAAR